jgi:hypothetical protein
MVTLLTILGPAGRRSAGPALSLPVRLRVTATGKAARGLGLHGCVEAGAWVQAGATRRTRAVLRGAVRSAARGRRIARRPAGGHGAINFKFWKGLGGRGEA